MQVAPDLREPRLARRELALLLAVVGAAQAWTLGRTQGYPLADAVEYMDRAWDVARGAGLGPESPRSFAFSALLLPFFLAARALELEDLRPVVLAVRLAQMALGLGAVAVTARSAARAFGRGPGIAAGLGLGLSAVFLLHTIEPLSGPAAMLCTALGFEACCAPPRTGRRAGLRAGLWLGLAAMMAYQTLPVSGGLGLLLVARHRWRGRGVWLGFAAAFSACLLAQCLLDLAVYGRFGSTLLYYVGVNVGAVGTRFLLYVGWDSAARWVYETFSRGGHAVLDGSSQARPLADPSSFSVLPGVQPPDFYVAGFTSHVLPLAGVVLVAVGTLSLVARPRWDLACAVLVAALDVAVLSGKGSKSFRLLLPILPLVAFTLAGGLGALARLPLARPAGAAAGWALVVAALAGGLGIARTANLSTYGGYWRAMERLGAAARDAERPVVAASAFHWAASFRAPAGVRYVKLPHHLDAWRALDEAQRGEVLEALARLDALLAHFQAVELDPALARAVGERMEVLDVFWEPETESALGPVALFVARRPDLPRGRATFAVEPLPAGGVAARVERVQHPARVVFEEGGTALCYLGFDLEPWGDAGTGAWLTHHWLALRVDGTPWSVRDRLADDLGREAWVNDARCHGALPVESWPPGAVVRETYFVPVPLDVRQYGGPYGRGQLYPAHVLLSARRGDGDGGTPVPPRRRAGGAPLRPPAGDAPSREPWRPVGEGGWRWSRGDLQVGGAWLPVPAARRFPAVGEP